MACFFIFSLATFNCYAAFFPSPKAWALVLSGGGARGAYEAGALKAVKEIGLDVEGVYGTSVGALNGAFYVQGALNELEEIWQKISFENVVTLPFDFSSTTSNFFKVSQIISTGGFNVTPLKLLIAEHLNEKKIRESGMDFGLVTIDISNFTPLHLYIDEIPTGSLIDYLMASANYPLFQRWKIGKDLYIDGGFYDNAPVSMALKRGFKKILLVDVSDIPIFIPRIPKGVEMKMIKPSGPLGGAMEFVPSKESMWEEMGYLDTMKAFGKFVGRRYYIYSSSKNIILDTLLKMDIDKLKEIAKIIDVNVNGCSVDFAVYEKIVPKLLEYFPSNSFESLNISILEYTANYLKIQRLRPYTQLSLCGVISQTKIPPPSFWNLFENGKSLKMVEFVKAVCYEFENRN